MSDVAVEPGSGPTVQASRSSEHVWLCRLALLVIAALAGVLYAWKMGQQTLEYYYAAADRSMSMSWHNFIFGAFDPAGTITVDKLPGALWFQALSVKAFGMHVWAIVLPQVIEGILTVLVLYRAVRRLAGPVAGLVAALVLAVSPATVALDRLNISDSLLILLLVLAADALSAAIARPAAIASMGVGNSYRLTGWVSGYLILAGVWIGLAFQAKEIEAWMVLPAFALTYLLSGPGPALRRVVQLTVAGVVVALVSLSWMAAVSLVPAANRPYVDGSNDNSVFAQAFSYNGLGRFGGESPLQIRAAQLDPAAPAAVQLPRSPVRLLRGPIGRDSGWLIPAAAIVAAWGIASRRGQPRGDPLRACFILWAGWLVTFFVVFSVISLLQPYYLAALSPAVAGIFGAGAVAACSRDRAPVSLTIGLVIIVAGTAAYSAWLASTALGDPGWLTIAIVAVGAGAIFWMLAGRTAFPAAATLAAGLAALLLVPAVASVLLAAYGEGAFNVPFEEAKVRQDVALSLGKEGIVKVAAVIPEWRSLEDGAAYVMAAQTAVLPSAIIYDSGLEALPIGGFDGTAPSPTLPQLKADIRHNLFHLVWVESASDPRLQWITTHCTPIANTLYTCVPADAANGAAAHHTAPAQPVPGPSSSAVAVPRTR
jgi:4-amino-4-deoxy-L-arabinose transferase-like glycosyltransferase